ncbi:MAG TPA: hypothetical protein VKG21_14205 [Casimicrobiaceae bacterium]|nr:hypothetical protein [Casimicrobiaceae bacterium]
MVRARSSSNKAVSRTALFSLSINCVGLESWTTQCSRPSPEAAIRAFLKQGALNQFVAGHDGWPKECAFRDIYAFLPLDSLTNVYFCGLGHGGKYVQITMFHTVQHRAVTKRKCPRLARTVTLRP